MERACERPQRRRPLEFGEAGRRAARDGKVWLHDTVEVARLAASTDGSGSLARGGFAGGISALMAGSQKLGGGVEWVGLPDPVTESLSGRARDRSCICTWPFRTADRDGDYDPDSVSSAASAERGYPVGLESMK